MEVQNAHRRLGVLVAPRWSVTADRSIMRTPI
jgi:hypothetical protein